MKQSHRQKQVYSMLDTLSVVQIKDMTYEQLAGFLGLKTRQLAHHHVRKYLIAKEYGRDLYLLSKEELINEIIRLKDLSNEDLIKQNNQLKNKLEEIKRIL
jgi:hypothetical protein